MLLRDENLVRAESVESQIISRDKQAHGPLRLLITTMRRHKAAGINYSA